MWQALVGMALEQNLVAMVTKTGAQRTYSAITTTEKVRAAARAPPPLRHHRPSEVGQGGAASVVRIHLIQSTI